MTDDELIRAGLRAWNAVRPVPFGTPHAFDIARATAFLRAVELLIRANEAAKWISLYDSRVEKEKQNLANLADEIEAAEAYIKRDDVLNLLKPIKE